MIYFAQTNDNQFIKIGYASNVTKRLGSLQTGNHIGIKLLACMPGDISIEQNLHQRFTGLRTRGEWFHANQGIIKFALSAHRMNGLIGETDQFLRYTILEPRLIDLLVEAASTVDTGDTDWFCANEIFFNYRDPRAGLKHRLSQLVGWESEATPVLQTSEAYDIAYDRIYDALPNCRNCSCIVQNWIP